MGFRERYESGKEKLLNDPSICKENKELFKEFFESKERKLKRQNNLATLDEPCYKTLTSYLGRLRNVNNWFKNKSWKELTKEDIQKVYDDLEDGKIKNNKGERYGDRASYYNKVFRSKPFSLAGKADLAREVLEDFKENSDKDVRFVTEEEFRKLISVVANPHHLALLWLQWDIGENVNTLLQLTKKDIIKQKNPNTKEDEYLVNLPKAKIKRSKMTRSEPTLYPETVRYLDMVFNLGKELFIENKKGDHIKKVMGKDNKYKKIIGKRKFVPLEESDPIFSFEHRQALKVIHRAGIKSGAKCMPQGDLITWKDLRSGMACHLLKKGWSRDEVNARLGHTPSSKSLNAYINYLALDRHKPKETLRKTNMEEMQNELEESKRTGKLQSDRIRRQNEELKTLQKQVRLILEQQGIDV